MDGQMLYNIIQAIGGLFMPLLIIGELIWPIAVFWLLWKIYKNTKPR